MKTSSFMRAPRRRSRRRPRHQPCTRLRDRQSIVAIRAWSVANVVTAVGVFSMYSPRCAARGRRGGRCALDVAVLAAGNVFRRADRDIVGAAERVVVLAAGSAHGDLVARCAGSEREGGERKAMRCFRASCRMRIPHWCWLVVMPGVCEPGRPHRTLIASRRREARSRMSPRQCPASSPANDSRLTPCPSAPRRFRPAPWGPRWSPAWSRSRRRRSS